MDRDSRSTLVELLFEIEIRKKGKTPQRKIQLLVRRWFMFGWLLGGAAVYFIGKTDYGIWILVGSAVVSIICHGLIDRQAGKLLEELRKK